jgi:hypothetical protein
MEAGKMQLSTKDEDKVESDQSDNNLLASMSPSMTDLEKDEIISIPRPVSTRRNGRLETRPRSLPASVVSRRLENMTDLERNISQHGCIDWNGPDDLVNSLSAMK